MSQHGAVSGRVIQGSSEPARLSPSELYALVDTIRRMYRVGFRRSSTDELISIARTFHARFWRSSSDRGRAIGAAVLLDVAEEMQRRLDRGFIEDDIGSFRVAGFDSSSPLAGLVEDIPPFHEIDLWHRHLLGRPRLRRRNRPRRQPPDVIFGTDEGEIITGTRPVGRNLLGRIPRTSQFRRGNTTNADRVTIIPEQSFASRVGQVGDVAGFLIELGSFVYEVAGGTVALEVTLGAMFGGFVLQGIGYVGALTDASQIATANASLRGFADCVIRMSNVTSSEIVSHPRAERYPGVARVTLNTPGDIYGDEGRRAYQQGVQKAREWAIGISGRRELAYSESQTYNVYVGTMMEIRRAGLTARDVRELLLTQLGARNTMNGYFMPGSL